MRVAEKFSQDGGLQTALFLCYISYVAQWWFRCSLQGHRERGFLDPRTPWTDSCDVPDFNNPSTCSRPDDSGGAAVLVPPRTPRSSGYGVYAHAVYVVICYMSLTCICLLFVSQSSERPLPTEHTKMHSFCCLYSLHASEYFVANYYVTLDTR